MLAPLVVPIAIALTACGGSNRSSGEAFCKHAQALDKTYGAINRRVGNSDSRAATERSIRASVRFYGGLRALQPPASSGVGVSEWKRVLGTEQRDWRSMFFLFYGREWHRLLRSWDKPLRTPKLPPGTGPTAATLAQAFNSPEGRRFNRLQNKLLKGVDVDFRASIHLMQTVARLCASHSGVTIGTTLTTTTQP